MIGWAGKRERPLISAAIAVLAIVLVAELYQQLSVRPLSVPFLLFELLEVVLLVTATVSCTLVALRVRVRPMAAVTVAVVAVLLAGELLLGGQAATLWRLLGELLEVVLLVSGSVACVLSLRGSNRSWR